MFKETIGDHASRDDGSLLMNHPRILNRNRYRCFGATSACGLIIFEISQMDAMRYGSYGGRWRECELIHDGNLSRGSRIWWKSARHFVRNDDADGWLARWWFGYLHCLMVALRELLGCNVIVFDAVILQCRAYTYASAAREHIGHIRGAKCRDNCRAFPSPPSGPSAAGSFAFWTSSLDARQPSTAALGSHLPSRTSFPSRRPGTPRGVPTNVLSWRFLSAIIFRKPSPHLKESR